MPPAYRLPIARLAGPELEVRLLVDHRERLVAQRTQLINDLRWHLHDLWPELEIPACVLTAGRWQDRVGGRLLRAEQAARVRIARDELRRIRELTRSIDTLQRELATLVAGQNSPRSSPDWRHLLDERGCGVSTAAKLIGEIASIQRFASDAKLARLAGSAPIPASSGRTTRHRFDAAATASSTARCTASPSPRAAWTPTPPPTSRASRPKARAAAKRCAASSATSPAASGDCCSHLPTPPQRRTHRPRPAPRPPSALTATLLQPLLLDIERTSVLKLHRHSLAAA
jgi:transposase